MPSVVTNYPKWLISQQHFSETLLFKKPIKYWVFVSIEKPQFLINNFMKLISKLLVITMTLPICV